MKTGGVGRAGWGVLIALGLRVVAVVACGPPPDMPPPFGAPTDSGAKVHDSSSAESGPTCQSYGGTCTDPTGSCLIEVAGKGLCLSTEGGKAGQICCIVGD